MGGIVSPHLNSLVLLLTLFTFSFTNNGVVYRRFIGEIGSNTLLTEARHNGKWKWKAGHWFLFFFCINFCGGIAKI
ncbi:hypothetical protein QBC42DRAFT_260845 [Cladorrhinum samala]|uniref:Uncharacterized protein n=1 Tax=Cladorrhinum samala TaxID=585594 RepID=A0AAV9HXY9_9PEZI|nr:hypothetical protein QBC42DRAFT_260845 [Cladorrhinum samala]